MGKNKNKGKGGRDQNHNTGNKNEENLLIIANNEPIEQNKSKNKKIKIRTNNKNNNFFSTSINILQALFSVTLLYQTILWDSTLRKEVNNDFKNNNFFENQEMFSLVNMLIAINGSRALFGLLGEFIDFTYFNNFPTSRFANYFYKIGQKCKVFEIFGTFSLLATSYGFSDYLYYSMEKSFENTFPVNNTDVSLYSNSSYSINNPIYFNSNESLLIFLKGINFGVNLLSTVNLLVFVKSLSSGIFSKLFNDQYPFLKIINKDGQAILIRNHNYKGNVPQYILENLKKEYNILEFNKGLFDERNNSEFISDFSDDKKSAYYAIKNNQYESFSPDLSLRKFNKKSLILGFLFSLSTVLIVPYLESLAYGQYEKLNDPLVKNTLFYLTASIAPLLTIYGAGLQGVSDILTKLYTESFLFKRIFKEANKENNKKSNKIISFLQKLEKKILYTLPAFISLFSYGYSRLFFGSMVIHSFKNQEINNLLRNICANLLVASGMLFENFYFFSIVKKNYENWVQSILYKLNNSDNMYIMNLEKNILFTKEEIKNNKKWLILNGLYNISAFCIMIYTMQSEKISSFFQSSPIDYNSEITQFSFLLFNLAGLIAADIHFKEIAKYLFLQNPEIKEKINEIYNKIIEFKNLSEIREIQDSKNPV
jgi:hypothetical protein